MSVVVVVVSCHFIVDCCCCVVSVVVWLLLCHFVVDCCVVLLLGCCWVVGLLFWLICCCDMWMSRIPFFAYTMYRSIKLLKIIPVRSTSGTFSTQILRLTIIKCRSYPPWLPSSPPMSLIMVGGRAIGVYVGGGVPVGIYRVVEGMGITNFTMVVPTVQSSRAGGWSGGREAREDYGTRLFGC